MCLVCEALETVHTYCYSHPTIMIFKLNYLKGKNKAYKVYEKSQQANYINKLFKSQLIKQQFKYTRL
jgi:hypothetical protein